MSLEVHVFFKTNLHAQSRIRTAFVANNTHQLYILVYRRQL